MMIDLKVFHLFLSTSSGKIVELHGEWNKGRGYKCWREDCALHFWKVARICVSRRPSFCHVHLESKWVDCPKKKKNVTTIYWGSVLTADCFLTSSEPMPKDQEQYYGFTQFAVELNELDSNLRPLLPPTDTRFRPDQRSLNPLFCHF